MDYYEGEKVANLTFKCLRVSSVAVIEVNQLDQEKEDLNVVYKIYTTCKHLRVQEIFTFNGRLGNTTCEDCRVS